MTLLISVFAAVLCTVLWYRKDPGDDMKVGVLCWMYWGASLMWLVDAVFAYAGLGAAYFTPCIWACRRWPWAWWSGWLFCW